MRVKFAQKDTGTLDNRCSTALSKVYGMIESNASTSCDDGQVAIVDCAIVRKVAVCKYFDTRLRWRVRAAID
jgi:hypothetical protein